MHRFFPNRIMITFSVFLLIACCQTVYPGNINVQNDIITDNVSWENNGPEAEKSVEEKMKDLRIEMVKLQILSRLNLKTLPQSVSPPSEFSREAIRILLQENEYKPQEHHHSYDSGERLIIHANSNGMECLQNNGSSCMMFRYHLSTSLNMSAMDLWIYKLTALPRWFAISLSCSSSSEERYYDRFYNDQQEIGWNKLQLPRLFLPSSWNDSITFSVQISGEDIEDQGDHRPFLMISKSYPIATRQRRDINCDTNESCCLKPLRVSFAEIGFNWVLYPVELEANMCTGKCSLDHSAMRTHYERAMTKVLENDNTLRGTLGDCWTLCCKPKQLEAVRVIYNDTDGIIHDQYIPELSVKSCSCS